MAGRTRISLRPARFAHYLSCSSTTLTLSPGLAGGPTMSPAKKGGAKRPARKSTAKRGTARKTAAPGRTAEQQRADDDAVAATSSAGRTTRTRFDSSADEQQLGTEQPPIAGAQAQDGNRSIAGHSAHGDQPADSTVRHAEPPTGKQQGEGEGGFPQGEYDVTQPAPAGAVDIAAQKDAALEAHFERAQVGLTGDLDAILKDALADSRLDETEIVRVTEALPVGIVIEHEGPNRWRCHKTGEGRYGHGRTHLEAVESYVLGLTASNVTDAAARAFVRLPASERKAIQERDERAARSVGGTDPNARTRAEALRTANLQAGADLPAPGARSDGAERASRTQAGAKRASAAKRTGAKAAKKGSSARRRSR